MKFEEVLKLLREGKKMRVSRWTEGDYVILRNGFLFDKKDRQYQVDFDVEDWEEYDEPLLNTDEEYILQETINFLNHFFNAKVEGVVKTYNVSKNLNREFIMIWYLLDEYNRGQLELPYFKKGTRFENLKSGKIYTLDELGLN